MEFCDNCGAAMVKVDDNWICRDCDPDQVPEKQTNSSRAPNQRSASLERLPITDSGSVRKDDAMEWLQSLEHPSDSELKDAILAKPNGFTGSTYATSISNIRLTGDPKFIETVAGLFKPLLDLEGTNTRIELNLQETEDRDTGEFTGNYALYLSVAERA